ncbi:hypothetical protein ES703_39968 [subsurface metagenome]
MSLTPKAIYEDFKNRDLDYTSAIELLITLIDNTDNIDTRLESIEILEKIHPKDDRVFKLSENLLISDSNKEIRNRAASLIKKYFLDRALEPMKWALEHEIAIECLITIISTFSEINNEKSKFILIEKLKYFYNQEYKYNLKDLLISNKIEGSNIEELAEILINYYFIKFLKMKFGYIKYEFNNSGFITKLDLTNVDPQGLFLANFLELVSSLKHLQVLDLRFNNIVKLSGISNAPNSLITLDLSYNHLINLTESIDKIKFLKTLNLKSNRLRSLPDTLGNLTSLETLNLRNNMLKKIPKAISYLTKIRVLDLHGNKLDSIDLKLNNSIKELELGWNNIIDVPDMIRSLTFLEKLGMSGNKLKKLPKWISSFNSLKVLNLYDNNIMTLPESIGNVKSLEVLILRNNKLSKLPDSFRQLKNLKRLNLSWNNFTFIPDWIGELDSLEELNLWGNQLEILPKSVSSLSQLKMLDLNFNKFEQLPPFLKEIERKKDLVIKY